MAGSLDFSVSSFFPESDTPIGGTEPAAPSAVPTYFAGLIYIFWMSLAGFRWRVRELCPRVFFFFAAAARLQNRLCRTPHHSELLCVIILHLLVLFGRGWCPASGVIRLIVLFSDLTLPVCRTGSAAATTTSDFFTCLFYIYWLCLALVRVLVLEFFAQLYFFFVFSPTGVLNRHCCAVHPAQHLRRFVYDFLA